MFWDVEGVRKVGVMILFLAQHCLFTFWLALVVLHFLVMVT